MKAFIIDRYGKKEAGRIGDLPQPVPGEHDVLVQVHAAGVNALDSKIGSGEFKLILPYRLPLVLGNDVAGPPTREFAAARELAWPLRQVMRLLSHGIRRKARQRGVDYRFVFMRADGAQLREITALVEAGVIVPVVDTVYRFQQTRQALEYSESGRAKGKIVLRMV